MRWPKDFDEGLVALWERSKKEDPKTPDNFEDFHIGLAMAGRLMLERSLDAKARESSLIQPARVVPKEITDRYVGRRS